MGISHVFKIVQMVANRAKRLLVLLRYRNSIVASVKAN